VVADPRNVPILLNRSACHLQKGNPAPCIADCTSVLDILTAADAAGTGSTSAAAVAEARQRHQQRTRALARRMAALVADNKFVAAHADAKAAAALDDALEGAVDRLARLVDAASAKETADRAAASAGPVGGGHPEAEMQAMTALEGYALALEREPEYVVARLNRSALYIKMGEYESAREDCRAIQALLEAGTGAGTGAGAGAGAGAGSSGGGNMGISPVPKKGSPLHAMVLQRAKARLEECEKHLAGGGTGGGGGTAS
jgi:tetratricopeptide (TPR) repeat protein